MENPITESKKEIIKWVAGLDDLDIIQKLLDLKDKNEENSMVSESQTEYAVKDDFDERFAKGIPHEEMKKRTIAHINSFPWTQ